MAKAGAKKLLLPFDPKFRNVHTLLRTIADEATALASADVNDRSQRKGPLPGRGQGFMIRPLLLKIGMLQPVRSKSGIL